MSRYIDAEKAIAHFNIMYDEQADKDDPYNVGVMGAINYIKHRASSIDIVFCRECNFSEVIQNDSSGVMARYCRAFTVPMMKSDDDYCSYGEREGE